MVKDTSIDFDDCVGASNEEDKPASLAAFLGLNDTPETEEEAEQFLTNLDPQKYWQGMPEYVANKTRAEKKLVINFRTTEDMLKFGEEVLKQKLTEKTKSCWWPERDRDQNILKRWLDESEA